MESRFAFASDVREMGKILRSKKKQQQQQEEKEQRERAAWSEVKKRRRMEKRIYLSSMAPQWNSMENYVIKVCPNAVKVLPPLPSVTKNEDGKGSRGSYKMEETTSC